MSVLSIVIVGILIYLIIYHTPRVYVMNDTESPMILYDNKKQLNRQSLQLPSQSSAQLPSPQSSQPQQTQQTQQIQQSNDSVSCIKRTTTSPATLNEGGRFCDPKNLSVSCQAVASILKKKDPENYTTSIVDKYDTDLVKYNEHGGDDMSFNFSKYVKSLNNVDPVNSRDCKDILSVGSARDSCVVRRRSDNFLERYQTQERSREQMDTLDMKNLNESGSKDEPIILGLSSTLNKKYYAPQYTIGGKIIPNTYNSELPMNDQSSDQNKNDQNKNDQSNGGQSMNNFGDSSSDSKGQSPVILSTDNLKNLVSSVTSAVTSAAASSVNSSINPTNMALDKRNTSVKYSYGGTPIHFYKYPYNLMTNTPLYGIDVNIQ